MSSGQHGLGEGLGEEFTSPEFKTAQDGIVKGYMYDRIVVNAEKSKNQVGQYNNIFDVQGMMGPAGANTSGPVGKNPEESFYAKILKSLVLDYLKEEKLYQTEGVFVPEAKIFQNIQAPGLKNFSRPDQVQSRSEIVNIFINKGAFASYNQEKCSTEDPQDATTKLGQSKPQKIQPQVQKSTSLLKALVQACFPHNETLTTGHDWVMKKDAACQSGDPGGFFGSLDDLDRKLLDIEKDFYKKANIESSLSSEDLKIRLSKAINRAKRDLRVEVDEEKRVWKELELKAMREDERRRLEERFSKFAQAMEDKLKTKLHNSMRNEKFSIESLANDKEKLLHKENSLIKKVWQDSEALALEREIFLKQKSDFEQSAKQKQSELEHREHNFDLEKEKFENFQGGREDLWAAKQRTGALGEELGSKLLIVQKEDFAREKEKFESAQSRVASMHSVMEDYKKMLGERDREIYEMLESTRRETMRNRELESSYESLMEMYKRNELATREYDGRMDNQIQENVVLKNSNVEIRALLNDYGGSAGARLSFTKKSLEPKPQGSKGNGGLDYKPIF